MPRLLTALFRDPLCREVVTTEKCQLFINLAPFENLLVKEGWVLQLALRAVMCLKEYNMLAC